MFSIVCFLIWWHFENKHYVFYWIWAAQWLPCWLVFKICYYLCFYLPFFFIVFFSSLCVWDCRVYVSSSWIYFHMTYSVQITQKWTLAFKLVGTREWAGQVVLTVECSYLYIILINLFRDIGFSPKEIMWNFIIMIITRSVHEAFILCSMVDVSKFVVSSTFKRLWFNYFLLYCQKLKSLLEIHMDP